MKAVTFIRALLRRHLSSSLNAQRYKVAIVGSGPAASYTAHHLLRKANDNLRFQVDFYERLPSPFGLSRYGVAPDHPEVKNCEECLEDLMADFGSSGNVTSHINTHHDDTRHNGTGHIVRFIGNTEVGKDISLKQLNDNYHSVVLSYGCTDSDNKLKIPGSDLPGVIAARQFVNWYNGHPDYHGPNAFFQPPPLDQIESVTIIGNGNVAFDVARVLLGDPQSHWMKTDINNDALELLKQSSVKTVNIVARRGILESAFSNKEFRELLEMSTNESKIRFIVPEQDELEELSKLDKKSLGRINKRRVKLFEDYIKKYNSWELPDGFKTWSLRYLKSPVEFIKNNDNPDLLSETKFVINELHHDELLKTTTVSPTEKFMSIKNELVILSIGYKGLSLKEFDSMGISFKNNHILNKGGRVLSTQNDDIEGLKHKNGWYTSGWIKNGPQGTIAVTMMDSFDTAQQILEDMANNIHTNADPKQFDITETLPNKVTWDDWKKLDRYEKEKGQAKGKPREKVPTIDQMLTICK